MRKTAIKMFLLGVAVLALFGAATAIKNKNSYAKTGVSEEALVEINASVDAWFDHARSVLEEAGEPHSDNDASDKNTAALGESVSVPLRGSNPGPWIAVVLTVAGGAALVVVAVSRQYRLAMRENSVSRVVEQIVAKSTATYDHYNQRRGTRRAQKNKKEDDFEEISRAVDEIVAKYSKKA